MGFGKSLKKFVKKAAPIIGMVAPFIPALAPFAPMIGAVAGGMGGGGLKGALMGGLGAYAAQGFGGGFAGAPQGTGFFGKLQAGLGGLGKAFTRQGFNQYTQGLSQGLGSLGKMFTGAPPSATTAGKIPVGVAPRGNPMGIQTSFVSNAPSASIFQNLPAEITPYVRPTAYGPQIGSGAPFGGGQVKPQVTMPGQTQGRAPGIGNIPPKRGYLPSGEPDPFNQPWAIGAPPGQTQGQAPGMGNAPPDPVFGTTEKFKSTWDPGVGQEAHTPKKVEDITHAVETGNIAVKKKDQTEAKTVVSNYIEKSKAEGRGGYYGPGHTPGTTGSGEPTTWESLVDFARNALNEQNRPLTAGLLGALAQWWENKQNKGAGDVTWGEGMDYSGAERGSELNKGGRVGFANGGGQRQGGLFGGLFGGGDEEAEEVRDPEYEGWKEMYEKNPEAAMMMHNNAAEYLKRYEMEMLPKEELNNNANGGIIGFARGGEPTHEMDYRPGGFIPVGAQERADDVPARLSKNEFVMTADAVRAAGGGSVDRGSQRMYDLMNRLEGAA